MKDSMVGSLHRGQPCRKLPTGGIQELLYPLSGILDGAANDGDNVRNVPVWWRHTPCGPATLARIAHGGGGM